MPNQNFDTVKCKRLLVQNGKSAMVEVRADKDGGAEFNFLGKPDGKTLANIIAVNVDNAGNIWLRVHDASTGELKSVDLNSLLWGDAGGGGDEEPPVID